MELARRYCPGKTCDLLGNVYDRLFAGKTSLPDQTSRSSSRPTASLALECYHCDISTQRFPSKIQMKAIQKLKPSSYRNFESLGSRLGRWTIGTIANISLIDQGMATGHRSYESVNSLYQELWVLFESRCMPADQSAANSSYPFLSI